MGDIRWPDGKKCAVMFTFDVDGDTTWENGNRGLKNGEKYIKSLSVGQYGPKRCVDRILQKLDQYGVKATFFVPGLTAERYPEVIKRIAEQGHEIGHHGYAHERFAGKTTEEQIEIIGYIKESEDRFLRLEAEAMNAIQLMQERRTALISAAVTGKIDLRGWRPPGDEVAA